MKFKFVALASALFALVSMGSAGASTYNLTLDNSSGKQIGTGSITISSSVPSTGASIFTTANGLTALNFSIAGNNFSLTQDPAAVVAFNNGNLASILYAGSLSGITLDLTAAGLTYAFVDLASPGLSSVGTISDPPGAAPLPASWTLMLIGLVAGGLVAFRRKSKMSVAAA